VLSIDLVTVPYDAGRRGFRMGAGPQALLRNGLIQKLRTAGYDVELVPVEATGTTQDEFSTALDLAAKVARVTKASRASGRFPLTLSGNCFSTVGAFASVAGDDAGVLWLDAHGDLNTPETSASGFFDGMAAATLLGWCHADRIREILPATLAESRLMLAGARDLDAPESVALQQSAVRVLSPAEVRDPGTAAGALDAFTAGMRELYLHVDVDVFDADQVGRANTFASPGGLTLREVTELVTAAGRRVRIAGMSVSSYDPAEDTDAAVLRAAIDVITASLALAAGPADQQAVQ
jgi:arginase